MITNKNIGPILNRIEKKMRKNVLPSVSMIATGSSSPFHVLIATILSLRTKDAVTLEASIRLFKIADTPESLMLLSQKQLEKLIYPVAFYRNKSTHILEICRRLIKEYDGIVPKELNELLKFKGVGRKTANLVQILGFGIPAMCVDTHVHRISNRFGYITTKTPDESELKLRQKLPTRYWLSYNDLLVTFGQNQCKPVSPICSTCPVTNVCPKVNVSRHR
ncbi:endonuclease III [bacterium]|nr:MAG: endonuclease III [bacterium]